MLYSNKLFREIYFLSPYLVKNTASTAFGMMQRYKRYGNYFQKHFELLSESQYWDESRIKDFQSFKIRETIDYSKKISGYENTDRKNIADYPLLTKDKIRSNLHSYFYPELKSLKPVWSHTSGTSGKALVFPLTIETFQREYAFRALHYSWAGVSLTDRDKIAMISGHPVADPRREKPPFWVYDRANNWLLFSSYHLNSINLRYYIEEIDRFEPKLIHGYPSSIYILSKFYKKYGKGKFKPNGVFTASETLMEQQRKEIESAFQTKVYNWYGNSEMTANIVECEHGELHLKHEHSFVEILNDDDQEARPGESGRLICTAFSNKAFPLIRYDIGDIVKISENQKSKCGRNGLLIESIEGRKEDYIITPAGKLVGRLDHIFKDTLNVQEAQIYQDDVSSLEFRIVPGSNYSQSDEKKILTEARLRLGNDIRIRINLTDKIQRGANGKFNFIISKIDQSNLLG